MTSVHVCSIQRAPAYAVEIGASAMVSILHREQTVETPTHLPRDAHLRLVFDDVSHYDPKYLMPDEAHVRQLVALGERWDRARPLLIHCTQGLSRSPAAALIVLCWFNKGRESEMARVLRAAAPFVVPNPRLVRLAAETLGWPALLDALRVMAQPDCSATQPFGVPLAPPSAAGAAIWGA